MPISKLGQLNTTALTVADVYVQIVPPQFLINGVPSNVGGIVGTATWGPVNQATIVGAPSQYASTFGPIQPRQFDMGTAAIIAMQQGATALQCVRVTDGTDAAASVVNQTNCITFTSKWTGTFGNGIQVTLGNGSKATTYSVKIAAPGIAPELFDNISGAANALWVNMAAAINQGQSQMRGPSQIIVATAGVGVTAPTLATLTLTGGSDGATTVTGTTLQGVDTFPRTGMYALRGYGVSVAELADLTDSTTWANQITFGQSEGIYMVTVGPAGQTPATAATAKTTAGVDDYSIKIMLGDWIYWNDTYNGMPQRLVSPQHFTLGKLLALSPNESTLNKPLNSVVGTQRSITNTPYTSAELQVLAQAGIDVICNPNPGGAYFGHRNGRNASSNAVIHGDNYTRMTNYLATTLDSAMGIYIGKVQTTQPNDPTRRQAKVTIDSFLQALKEPVAFQQVGMIDDFNTILDLTNNPPNRQALGYMQADVQVRYGSIVEFFIINLEGGQSVTIERTNATFAN